MSMTGIVILNAVFVAMVLVAVLGILAWGIISTTADERERGG